MLTRARSLFSRVFSLDNPPAQTRLDDMFDDIDDESSDDNEAENAADDEIDNNVVHHEENGADDDRFSDSDDDWSPDCRQAPTTNSKVKGKYERQINECPAGSTSNPKSKATLNYARSHEKSKQTRLISAMQIATSRCNVESMKRLLTNFDIDINHRDQYGMSYLEHAILVGSIDMVHLLVSYGCDLHQGALSFVTP